MKNGRQRREEIKAQRKQRNAKRNSPQAKPRQAARPVGNVPVNEQALAPYNASARLRLLCAAIIRTLLFVVMAVAKRRSGQQRNKSGGMKSLRVTITRTQSF